MLHSLLQLRLQVLMFCLLLVHTAVRLQHAATWRMQPL